MLDKSNYYTYLQSDKWREKKQSLISIFGNKCEACGNLENIQCHHGTYKYLFDEKLHHIFLLCSNCHLEYHKTSPKLFENGEIIGNCHSISETEYFISGKLNLLEKLGKLCYGDMRRKILRKHGIKCPQSC